MEWEGTSHGHLVQPPAQYFFFFWFLVFSLLFSYWFCVCAMIIRGLCTHLTFVSVPQNGLGELEAFVFAYFCINA